MADLDSPLVEMDDLSIPIGAIMEFADTRHPEFLN